MSIGDRRLPWLQPIQSRRADRYVYSFKELINSINELPEAHSSFDTPSAGKVIIINAPITFEKTIELDAQQAGLTICSLGSVAITPSISGMTAFRITTTASRFTFRNLFAPPVVLTSNPYTYRYWNKFIEITNGADNLTVDGCEAYIADNGKFIDITSGTSYNNIVKGNRINKETHDAVVDYMLDGAFQRMCFHNNMFSDYCGVRITGGECAISNNYFLLGKIDTHSSSGSNSITGNVGIATLTQHPTDAVGDNS